MPCDQIVDRVSHWPWHNNQPIKQRPRKPQPPGDPQGRSRACVQTTVLDQCNAIRQLTLRSPLQHTQSRIRSQRCETESAGGIMGDHKLDGPVAQVANSVKKHNGMILHSSTSHNDPAQMITIRARRCENCK
jgi:hypothetical protein